MLNREQMINNAIENLEIIKCYKPYLNAFKSGTITMYESFGGYYIEEEDELLKKIREIEEKYTGVVYAVIHQITNIGELYTMLWAGDDEESHYEEVNDAGGGSYYVLAYVWNKTDEWCSEFGDVLIKPALGGLLRIG